MRKNKLKIVLLGSLPKGDNARKTFMDWKLEYIEKIQKKIPEAIFIHGDLISDKEGSEVVVGHDLWLIKHADIVIVHAISKIGAGTAQEMVIAKIFKKPVISVIPKDTHHRKSNIVFHETLIKDWIHPFLDVSSDAVVQNIDEVIVWIKKYMRGSLKVKDFSVFDKTIQSFEKKLPKAYTEYIKK
ncbi:MAG TPA: hypothetical protein VNW29_04965 [Candidatus Sulfotelmatobacter sp.]|jgi:hypothetical protein|nr:hypothetical protein [Candidatus Sulfotelmatobacter sp.]